MKRKPKSARLTVRDMISKFNEFDGTPEVSKRQEAFWSEWHRHLMADSRKSEKPEVVVHYSI